MKKITLAAMILMIFASAFTSTAVAATYTGKVAELIPDDGEGVRVIMQIGTGIVLYTSRSSKDHSAIVERLEKAKSEDKAVSVEASNGAVAEIVRVFGN